MPRYENVLVTGASRGLGAALVAELLARGHRVVMTARHEGDLARLTHTLREQHGDRVNFVVADLANPIAAQHLVGQVEQRFGALDALINNAGTGTYKPLIEWSADEVITCMNVNLMAPMLLTQAVLPSMLARRRGYIVNVASDLARRPLANMSAYVASKFGLLGFSGSVLREAKSHGVKVTAVLPGIIDTAFNGAVQGSKEETWALRPEGLASQIAALFELPENVLIDELTIHPQHQDF
jgi:short-subunit dehydrogenase